MGKILGIDFGEKRIGLALSDEGQKYAFGRPTIKVDNWPQAIGQIKEICQAEGVEKIILGWPKPLIHASGKLSGRLEAFKEGLAREAQLPIVLEDERLTTRLAERWLKEAGRKQVKAKLDELAAVNILQTYLDRTNREKHDRN